MQKYTKKGRAKYLSRFFRWLNLVQIGSNSAFLSKIDPYDYRVNSFLAVLSCQGDPSRIDLRHVSRLFSQ